MTKPDPAQRPSQVVWAYRCWAASGALLVLAGVAYVVIGVVQTGPTLEPVGIGVLVAAVGGAYFLMGSKAYLGDERWRSSLAALTLVAVVMLLVLSFVYNVIAFALLFAVVGLFGSLMAFRPESDAWFTGKDPATVKQPGMRKRGKK